MDGTSCKFVEGCSFTGVESFVLEENGVLILEAIFCINEGSFEDALAKPLSSCANDFGVETAGGNDNDSSFSNKGSYSISGTSLFDNFCFSFKY